MSDTRKTRRRRLWNAAVPVGVTVLISVAYLFGAYSFQQRLWPIAQLRLASNSPPAAPQKAGSYDDEGRLVAYPRKAPVECPQEGPDTAVILIIGQSNAANHGAERIASRYPQRVFNMLDGKCFTSGSPLLGGSGEGGEIGTPLADALIDAGAFAKVVLISAAVGGSPVARWEHGADLNVRMQQAIGQARHRAAVTHVVWHQGEADAFALTAKDRYIASFKSLLDTLNGVGVRAPVFIARASKCGIEKKRLGSIENQVTAAQERLVDGKRVFLGADTDGLLQMTDRQADHCHLSRQGLLHVGRLYAEAITAGQSR